MSDVYRTSVRPSHRHRHRARRHYIEISRASLLVASSSRRVRAATHLSPSPGHRHHIHHHALHPKGRKAACGGRHTRTHTPPPAAAATPLGSPLSPLFSLLSLPRARHPSSRSLPVTIACPLRSSRSLLSHRLSSRHTHAPLIASKHTAHIASTRASKAQRAACTGRRAPQPSPMPAPSPRLSFTSPSLDARLHVVGGSSMSSLPPPSSCCSTFGSTSTPSSSS